MKRKPVARRLAAVADLRAVLRAGGATIAGRLADRPAAPLDETLVYRLLLDHLEAELIAVDLDLTAAEDRYARDQARATALRREHADARSSLYRRQHRIPPILSHLPNGQRDLEQAAIASATSRASLRVRDESRTEPSAA